MPSGLRIASRRIALAAALAAGIVAPVTGPVSAAPAPTVIHDCSGKAFVEPEMIESIFCADVGIIVTDIRWSRWTAELAVGNGVEHRKTCVPNCAEGPIAVQPVDVTLFAPANGEFTQIRLGDEYGVSNTYKLTGTLRR